MKFIFLITLLLPTLSLADKVETDVKKTVEQSVSTRKTIESKIKESMQQHSDYQFSDQSTASENDREIQNSDWEHIIWTEPKNEADSEPE